MGGLKAADIVAGGPGEVYLRNWANDHIFYKDGLRWTPLDKEKVITFAVGNYGRLYKRMKEGNKIMMQVTDRRTEKKIKKCTLNFKEDKPL